MIKKKLNRKNNYFCIKKCFIAWASPVYTRDQRWLAVEGRNYERVGQRRQISAGWHWWTTANWQRKAGTTDCWVTFVRSEVLLTRCTSAGWRPKVGIMRLGGEETQCLHAQYSREAQARSGRIL